MMTFASLRWLRGEHWVCHLCISWWCLSVVYPSSSLRAIRSLIRSAYTVHGHTNSAPAGIYTDVHKPPPLPLWFKLMVKPGSMRESGSWRFTLPGAAIILCLSRHPPVLWWWRHDERKPLFHLSPISRVSPPAFSAAIKPACRFLGWTPLLTADLFRK